MINTVYERRAELQKEFQHILDHHKDFDSDSVSCTDGYVNVMSKTELDMHFSLKSCSDFCDIIKMENMSLNTIYKERVSE